MISFEPTEEQVLVRDTARQFAAEVLRVRARDADETSSAPADVLSAAWELGLIASQIPESCGGGGAPRSPTTFALLLEELGAGDAGLALAAFAPALFAMTIVEQGSVKQQQRFLPQFCGRDFHVASVALVEPRPAFDPLALDTVAEARGEGFVLRGRKSFVPFAASASHFLVIARESDAQRGGLAGVSAFVVPRDASGLTVTDTEPTLGLRAVPFAGLELDGVEVPPEDRIGGTRGFDYARLLATSRVGLAATLVGLSRAVMEYAIPYAKERVAFGEPIARKQAIAFMLADMAIETDAMRWMVWKAASELEQGKDATRSAHLARSYVAEQAMKIADNGVQVLGGHGFIREHPVEMWYRHARTIGVLEGAATV